MHEVVPTNDNWVTTTTSLRLSYRGREHAEQNLGVGYRHPVSDWAGVVSAEGGGQGDVSQAVRALVPIWATWSSLGGTSHRPPRAREPDRDARLGIAHSREDKVAAGPSWAAA